MVACTATLSERGCMNTWKGYLRFKSESGSLYREVSFPLPEELEGPLQRALAGAVPLRSCSFYPALCSEAGKAFDLFEDLGLREEKPRACGYYVEKEYQSVLKEYEEYCHWRVDQFRLADVQIEDPGEMQRFRDRFIGRQYSACAGCGSKTLSLREEGERVVTYRLCLHFDEQGALKDITDLTASGFERGNQNHSITGPAYPDYELLAGLLEDRLRAGSTDVL